LKFDFENEKIRGVNLGGWFVLEPWITPSIFKATPKYVLDGNDTPSFRRVVTDVDVEFTYCLTLGQYEARSRLEQHWSNWIVQEDFHQIAAAGMNFVRIPIGYWSIINDNSVPYVQGAFEHFARALDWAHGAGLNVMIDLHGGKQQNNISHHMVGKISHTDHVLLFQHLARRMASITLAKEAISNGRRAILSQ
jgi:glucan 1,3-beta-glucosidase